MSLQKLILDDRFSHHTASLNRMACFIHLHYLWKAWNVLRFENHVLSLSQLKVVISSHIILLNFYCSGHVTT